MIPTKSMDYVNEMNRLFSRTRDRENLSQFTPPYQTLMVNRSSSSAESTSPESYFETYLHSHQNDISLFSPRPSDTSRLSPQSSLDTSLFSPRSVRQNYENSLFSPQPITHVPPRMDFGHSTDRRLHQSHSIYEPLQTTETPRRPVGRKILGNSQFKPVTKEDIWNTELPRSPDSQKSYELFPIEKTEFTNLSPIRNLDFTPTLPKTNSPTHVPVNLLSQNVFAKTTRPLQNIPSRPFTPLTNAPGSLTEMQLSKTCTFCRKNGERPIVYMTHCVKEKVGDKYKVTCPILRHHKCDSCGATGDDAHTKTYCPLLRIHNNGKPLESTTITLKNTRLKSNGRRRY